MKINLTQEQLELAKELAKKRHEAKNIKFKNTGILTNTKKKSMVEEYIHDRTHKPHFLGILGEIAYALHTKQNIDTNIYEVRDTGFDVGSVEVKTSTWMGGGVELKIKKQEFISKTPEKYVLARIDENNFNTVELMGEITRENFDKNKITKQYRSDTPVNYIVGTKYLTPIS